MGLEHFYYKVFWVQVTQHGLFLGDFLTLILDIGVELILDDFYLYFVKFSWGLGLQIHGNELACFLTGRL